MPSLLLDDQAQQQRTEKERRRRIPGRYPALSITTQESYLGVVEWEFDRREAHPHSESINDMQEDDDGDQHSRHSFFGKAEPYIHAAMLNFWPPDPTHHMGLIRTGFYMKSKCPCRKREIKTS